MILVIILFACQFAAANGIGHTMRVCVMIVFHVKLFHIRSWFCNGIQNAGIIINKLNVCFLSILIFSFQFLIFNFNRKSSKRFLI